MENTPKISVLMAAYNAEKYISEAIQSILDQTFTDFELIIVNDGSTDNTKEKIETFKDQRIRYHENEGNCKIIYTRNKLLNLAKGKYIAWLDADDISTKNRLLEQFNFMENNPDYGICGSWAILIDENGHELNEIWKPISHSEIIKFQMIFSNNFITSSVFMKNFDDENYTFSGNWKLGEDYNFWLKVISNYKSTNIKETLTFYRINSSGATLNGQNIMNENKIEIIENHLNNQGLIFNEIEKETHSSLVLNKYITLNKLIPYFQKLLLHFNHSKYLKEILLDRYTKNQIRNEKRNFKNIGEILYVTKKMSFRFNLESFKRFTLLIIENLFHLRIYKTS